MNFVLDQNFPWQVTALDWPPYLQLSPLKKVAPHLTRDYDDWQVLLALDRRGDVDGVITNDAKILDQATEVVVLHQSRLVLVVTDGVGDDPIRATGLVMVHLKGIAKQPEARPRIHVLRSAIRDSRVTSKYLDKIARQRRISVNELIANETEKIREWDSSS